MPHELDMTIDVSGVSFPRLDEYFGLWAFDAQRFQTMFGHVSHTNLAAHVRSQSHEPKPHAAPRVVTAGPQSPDAGNIAVVRLSGTLMKQESSLEESTSTIRARADIRAAARDTSIGGILLIIDSPGGTVSGTADLAAEVRKAREQKPVYSYIEDLGASAAYWVATQADKVFANTDTALVGSIGTIAVVYDYSGMAEKEGIKAMVFATGPLKGAGVPGTEITDAQQKYFQGIVNQTQSAFDAAIKSARGFTDEQLESVRTGAVFLAKDAQAKGLIDGVQAFDATIAQLFAEMQQRQRGGADADASSDIQTKTEITAMADENNKAPQPATYQQIKEACPGADAQFICDQLERGATETQATRAWMETQQARLESRDKQIADAKAEAEKTKSRTPVGVEAVGDEAVDKGGAEAATDPIEAFNEAVQAKLKATNGNRQRAFSAVVKANPELHQQYLEAYNAQHGRKAG